jgi:hypothetical protein
MNLACNEGQQALNRRRPVARENQQQRIFYGEQAMESFRLTGALAACLFILNLFAPVAHAAMISGQGTWETTLQARDFDGNTATIEGYYDTVLGITWLADANYAGTTMNWATANAWAAGLDLDGIAGPDGWRLPDTVDVGNDGATYTNIYQGVDYGYNITTHSEMSHMFYNTLGNTAWYDTSGTTTGCTAPNYCLTNTGPFSNLQSSYYWSATEYAPDTADAWDFYFRNGNQTSGYKTDYLYAWAVHSGDVGASIVPVPAAVWLFGSGLLGLVGLGRQRRR